MDKCTGKNVDALGGWLTFISSIVVIGILTAIVGDLANHFGCTVGLKDTLTAITFVAVGTSLPGLFKHLTVKCYK